MYAAAALATAVTTVASLAFAPASGSSAPPAQPARSYIVTAHARADARALVAAGRWRVSRYYTSALPGFAAMLTDAEAAELRADTRVSSLEPDRRIHPNRTLNRVESRATTVYVLGNGIDLSRAALRHRAWAAFDATPGSGNCHGSDTRVARRIAAGSPESRIASVRVLGCDGSGTLSDLLAGLDWVRGHARGPAVATLSAAVTGSPALSTAVHRLMHSGVSVLGAPHRLESAQDFGPPALASWPKSTPARVAIRQNPSRTLSHSGGF